MQLKLACLKDLSLQQWIILLLSVVSCFIEALTSRSFSTIMTHLMDKYGGSMWLLTIISTIPVAISYLGVGIVMTTLPSFPQFYKYALMFAHIIMAMSTGITAFIDPSDYHWYALTYAPLYSIGISLHLGALSLLLADYFPTEHSCHVLGTTMFAAGYPIGTAVGNLLTAEIIHYLNLPAVFIVFAVNNLVFALIFAPFMRPPQSDQGEVEVKISKEENKEISDKNLESENDPTVTSMFEDCCRIHAILWLVGKFLGLGLWFSIRQLIVAYVYTLNNGDLVTASTIMIPYASCKAGLGLILPLFNSTLSGRLNCINLFATLLLLSINYIIFFLKPDFFTMFFLVGFCGVGFQIIISTAFPCSEEVLRFGLRKSFKITTLFMGAGVIFSPFYGLLFDIVAEPRYLFLIHGTLWLVVCLCHVGIKIHYWKN